MSVSSTHVRPSPLLARQFLLLGVGGGQLQVEHWLQSGGASVDPLASLVVLTNIKQHADATLYSVAIFISCEGRVSWCRRTRKRILTRLPSTSSTLLLHQVPSHSVLMIWPTFRSTIGLLG